ncbi:MAG TPA: LptA/OstA family protein [Caulobacteraceae bacterium]|jgi:lipopolysaccharide export system protein LptA
MRARLPAAIGLAAALALTGAARAQISQGPDASSPIDITADQAVVDNIKCMTVWSGSAEALQGDSRLRANSITAYLKPKAGAPAPTPAAADPTGTGQNNCGATDRIEADGDVYYVTPTQIAHGAHAVYTADANQIVMSGDVIVLQGRNVARGDRMTIDTVTHEVHLDAAAKGQGKPGRVRAFFYPSEQQQPGAVPAAKAGG